jgi:hypothetical protein
MPDKAALAAKPGKFLIAQMMTVLRICHKYVDSVASIISLGMKGHVDG